MTGSAILTIFKKEFIGLLRSPFGWIMACVYALLSLSAAFYGGNYLGTCVEGNTQFFQTQPEILPLAVPALAVTFWANEKRRGTFEFLISQPVAFSAIVIGKFLSAWSFYVLLLFLVSGLWISASFLVPVSTSLVAAGIVGCILTAGAFIALASAVSFPASGTVSAFILSLVACIVVKMINFEWLWKLSNVSGEIFMRSGQALNFDYHFQNFMTGRLSAGDIVYFLGIIAFSLWFNTAALAVGRR